MSINKKISQAKAKLLVNYPYFGTIASKLELIQNDDIQAFKSDGKTIEYNSDFLQNIELSKVEFILANGAMHASLAHEQRKSGRSGWLWQMATDYAVNDMLVENGLERPDEATYSKRFSGLYAEEIYAQLKEELQNKSDDLDEITTDSEEQSSSSEVRMIELNELLLEEQLFDEFAKSVLASEETKDELPKSIERFFNLKSSGKIDWRDELKIAIDKFHKDDYVLIPPNKKFLYMGVYLPSTISNKFELVIAVDSSGSVDEELLEEFLNEVDFLMSSIQNFQIDLLVCDDKIHSHKVFYSGDSLDVKLQGNGGTDFRPVFEFVKDELPDTKLLLYFTDLEGTFPSTSPNYDVKWISSKEEDIPFGDVILL